MPTNLGTLESSIPTTSGQLGPLCIQLDSLTPMPHELQQQDFEYFVAALPDDPPAELYTGHLADESYFQFISR